MYLDTSIDKGIVLHVRHGRESVNLGHSEPVEDVRHKCLEAHVLYTMSNPY